MRAAAKECALLVLGSADKCCKQAVQAATPWVTPWVTHALGTVHLSLRRIGSCLRWWAVGNLCST